MKKKFLAMLLACAALFTAGCESIGKNSSQWIDSSIKGKEELASHYKSIIELFFAHDEKAIYETKKAYGHLIREAVTGILGDGPEAGAAVGHFRHGQRH